MEAAFLIFATIGSLLTIYFGFFRYKHFMWAKRKVQYDLFTKLNQRSDQAFIRISSFRTIRHKNEKIASKRRAILQYYLQIIKEKLFYMEQHLVSKEMAFYWLDVCINQLQSILKYAPDAEDDIKELISEHTLLYRNMIQLLLTHAINVEKTDQLDLQQIYNQIMALDEQ